MNRNLDKAIFDIGKVDALMRSMERLCLDFEVPPEEQEHLDTAASAAGAAGRFGRVARG